MDERTEFIVRLEFFQNNGQGVVNLNDVLSLSQDESEFGDKGVHKYQERDRSGWIKRIRIEALPDSVHPRPVSVTLQMGYVNWKTYDDVSEIAFQGQGFPSHLLFKQSMILVVRGDMGAKFNILADIVSPSDNDKARPVYQGTFDDERTYVVANGIAKLDTLERVRLLGGGLGTVGDLFTFQRSLDPDTIETTEYTRDIMKRFNIRKIKRYTHAPPYTLDDEPKRLDIGFDDDGQPRLAGFYTVTCLRNPWLVNPYSIEFINDKY